MHFTPYHQLGEHKSEQYYACPWTWTCTSQTLSTDSPHRRCMPFSISFVMVSLSLLRYIGLASLHQQDWHDSYVTPFNGLVAWQIIWTCSSCLLFLLLLLLMCLVTFSARTVGAVMVDLIKYFGYWYNESIHSSLTNTWSSNIGKQCTLQYILRAEFLAHSLQM